MGRAERMRSDRSDAGIQAAPSPAHAAAFSKAGLAMPQVLEWVKFFGSSILPFLMQLLSALNKPKAAAPPTEEQMTVLAEHGLTAEQAGMFTAAGLDTTQLLQWFLAFASSGKIPQLIQLIMQVIAIVKPNLPPTPVPPAPTPTSEQEA